MGRAGVCGVRVGRAAACGAGMGRAGLGRVGASACCCPLA